MRAHLSVVCLLVGLASILQLHDAQARPASEEQMQKAFKMIRGVCQPKTKATDDALTSIGAGNIPDDAESKCYMACVMGSTMTLKNNKVDFAMLKKQAVKMMPPAMAQKMAAAVDQCTGFTVGPEPCQTAFNFVACLTPNFPEFRLPV